MMIKLAGEFDPHWQQYSYSDGLPIGEIQLWSDPDRMKGLRLRPEWLINIFILAEWHYSTLVGLKVLKSTISVVDRVDSDLPASCL